MGANLNMFLLRNQETLIAMSKKEPNYIADTLKIAQITSDSLLYEIEVAMRGRAAFIDNTPIEEKIFYGDVFNDIIEEGKVSEKAMSQLKVLNEQVEYYNYIQII